MKYTKIDDDKIEVEDEPIKRIVSITYLKTQKQALQAQKQSLQVMIDKIQVEIDEAKKLGIE